MKNTCDNRHPFSSLKRIVSEHKANIAVLLSKWIVTTLKETALRKSRSTCQFYGSHFYLENAAAVRKTETGAGGWSRTVFFHQLHKLWFICKNSSTPLSSNASYPTSFECMWAQKRQPELDLVTKVFCNENKVCFNHSNGVYKFYWRFQALFHVSLTFVCFTIYMIAPPLGPSSSYKY